MATSVKGDWWYEKLDGKLLEIKRQMRQAGGYPYDPAQLDRALQALIEGRFNAIVGAKKATCSFADLIPDGWKVAEDVAPSSFDVSKLKLVAFLKKGESAIGGVEMRKRAIELKGNLGLADGQRLLAEQDKIPVEFRDYYIVLSGTVLRGSGGDLDVPCLAFFDGRWVLDFFWLDDGWHGLVRFACCE